MSVPYSALAKKARDEVVDLEEPYRSIAFETILQDLIRESKRAEVLEPKKPKRETPEASSEDPVDLFLTHVVDAGSYTKLFSSKGKLVEKSLAVLKLAREQLGVDGMTAPQVTEVLTKKFRAPRVYRQNVTSGLSKATEYVSRLRVDDTYKYLLMAPGEQYLQEVVSEIG